MDVNQINSKASAVLNGRRIVARLDGYGVYYTVEVVRSGTCVYQSFETRDYAAAVAVVSQSAT